MYRRHKSKYVGSRANTQLVQTLVRRLEKGGEQVGLRHSIRCRKDLRRKTFVRLGKPNVVELNFVEAEVHQLLGDTNVVIPERVIVGIHPGIALLVMPDRAIRLTNVPRRIHLRGRRVLEDDDPRRGEDVVRVQ